MPEDVKDMFIKIDEDEKIIDCNSRLVDTERKCNQTTAFHSADASFSP